jgi:DNA-binding winged helix-turn-helix (wHTH) protein
MDGQAARSDAHRSLSSMGAAMSVDPDGSSLAHPLDAQPLSDSESILPPSGEIRRDTLESDAPPLSARTERAPRVAEPVAQLGVVLDEATATVRIRDRVVELTRTQFSIFSYLFASAGHWVTASELIHEVLGTHHLPDTSLIRVHVHAIRRRLGPEAEALESDRRRARGYRWRGLIEHRPPSEDS